MTQMQVCSLDDAPLARFHDNTTVSLFRNRNCLFCYCTLCRYLGSLRTSVYMGRMERCGTAFLSALHQIRCSRAAPKRSKQLGLWYVSITRLHYSYRGCCLCAVLWLAPPPTFLSSLTQYTYRHMHTRALSFTLFLTTLSLFHALTLMHTTLCLSSYDTLSHLKLTLSHSLSLLRSHSPCSTWRRPLAVPADIAYTTALLSILLLSGLFTSMDICLKPMVSSLRPLIDYFLKWKEASSTMVREHAPACCIFSSVEHVSFETHHASLFCVTCNVQGTKNLKIRCRNPTVLESIHTAT